MNISLIEKIRNLHLATFNIEPLIVKSPGRANIIGEHTDYNYGKVLPFAIKKAIYFCISKNHSKAINIYAIDINESHHGSIENLQFQNTGWTRYLINALVVLDIDNLIGLDITFGGDLPSGAGVSSSSAITCGFLYGMNIMYDLHLQSEQLISYASQAENGIGLNGGTMDQTSIIMGIDQSALLIDYNDNTITTVPLDLDNHQFYLIESGQKHDLVETEYNKRRETCERALEIIQKHDSNVISMADISYDHIDKYISDPIMTKRCRHVVSENQRVIEAVTSIEKTDFNLLGQLMNNTHDSLSHLYEVSTPEIDWLVKHTLQLENVLGSRIMGGGFGGCTITLSKGILSESDIEGLTSKYKAHTGLKLHFHLIKPSSGVKQVNSDNYLK